MTPDLMCGIVGYVGRTNAVPILVRAGESVQGVAHTRSTTHGRTCDQNAHPHRDGSKSVAVVHNGIIENHAHLRESLARDGHTFESQTDTVEGDCDVDQPRNLATSVTVE